MKYKYKKPNSRICYLKSKIAGYKIPSKIYFVNDFEYNANGKIVVSKQIEACRKIETKQLIKTLRKGYNSDIKN